VTQLKNNNHLKNLYLDLNIKPKRLSEMSSENILIKCLRDLYVNEYDLFNDEELNYLIDLIKEFRGKKSLSHINSLWSSKKLRLDNPRIEYFARKYQDLYVKN